MKTIEVVKLNDNKGAYVNVRYNGQVMANEFCKTKKATDEKVKAWKAKGYTLNKARA